MMDNFGFGVEFCKKGNEDVFFGCWDFRDFFVDMLDSIKILFNECIEFFFKNIILDLGFK